MAKLPRSKTKLEPPVAEEFALYRPNERECALIILRLIQVKERESASGITRLRVAEISLKRMWGRQRLDPMWVDSVASWLLAAGWVLLFAGTTYGLVRVSSVQGWSRVSSKAISEDLRQIEDGRYDFSGLEPLLRQGKASSEDE